MDGWLVGWSVGIASCIQKDTVHKAFKRCICYLRYHHSLRLYYGVSFLCQCFVFAAGGSRAEQTVGSNSQWMGDMEPGRARRLRRLPVVVFWRDARF